jgi:hypothetical protein
MGDADLRLYAYKQFKYPVPNVLSKSSFLCFDYYSTLYCLWCMYRAFFVQFIIHTNKCTIYVYILLYIYVCRIIYRMLLIYIVHLLVWIIYCTLYCFTIHTGLPHKTCSVIKLDHKTTQKFQISSPTRNDLVGGGGNIYIYIYIYMRGVMGMFEFIKACLRAGCYTLSLNACDVCKRLLFKDSLWKI